MIKLNVSAFKLSIFCQNRKYIWRNDAHFVYKIPYQIVKSGRNFQLCGP